MTFENSYFRMKLVFDEEKVTKDGKYDIDVMYEWLDKICSDTWFKKTGKGEYELIDHDEIGSILVLISRFEQQSWLIPNLKSWKTYCEEEGEVDALKVVLND